MKYFDAFTGIGGFTLAITQAYEDSRLARKRKCDSCSPRRQKAVNGERMGDSQANRNMYNIDFSTKPTCVGFSEIDKYAAQIYQKHFPTHKNYGDITKITAKSIPDFDLFVGGFPCQAFSIAGKRRGFEDTRGTLFFEIVRILKAKRPRYFILENVKGLLSHDEGNTFKTIISTLDELGYFVEWQVLNSKNFGVPQNRERVFIVGYFREESKQKIFPIRKISKSDSESSKKGCTNTLTGKSAGGMNWRGNYIANCLDANYMKGNSLTKDRHTPRTEIQTDDKIRRLTPLECERLQGFPDNWTEGISDTQRYKCCGNAVTVNVVRYIINKMFL